MTIRALNVTSLAVLVSLAGAAWAAVVTVPPGGADFLPDPSSGQEMFVCCRSGAEVLSFSAGQFAGVDVNTVGASIRVVNLVKVRITPIAPATTYSPGMPYPLELDGVRVGASIQAPVATLSLDNQTGEFGVGSSSGVSLSTRSSMELSPEAAPPSSICALT